MHNILFGILKRIKNMSKTIITVFSLKLLPANKVFKIDNKLYRFYRIENGV